MNGFRNLVIFSCLILLIASASARAQEASALDQTPSVDKAAQLPVTPSEKTNPEEDASTESLRPGEQSNYVYDLKRLINQSKDNIRKVNEKIKEQAIVKRNQKREEKAREYYDLGMKLTQEGKLDEAREYFEKAIRITEHPEMHDYIKESQRKLKAQEAILKREDKQRIKQLTLDEKSKEEDVKKAYDEAISLYRQKKYREAKETFEHIESLIPDYRATQSYLQIIDQDILIADGEVLKQQKKEMERQEKEAEAARAREKEAWRKEIELKEKQRKSQLSLQAQDVYDQAIELYKQKKFKEAKQRFQEVAWVIPDYKATNNYLKRIDKDESEWEAKQAKEQEALLSKQRWEEEVLKSKQEKERKLKEEAEAKIKSKQLEEQAAFTYDAAVAAFDKASYDEALDKFKDIDKNVPGFRGVRIYIAKIEKIKADKARKEAEEKERLEKQQREEQIAKEKAANLEKFGPVYLEAVALFNQKQMEPAKEKFLQVKNALGSYQATDKYLRQIERALPKKTIENDGNINPIAVGAKPVDESKQTALDGFTSTGPSKKSVSEAKKAPEKKTLSVDEQVAQAKEISELANQSQQLLNQMASLEDDRFTNAMTRKLMTFNQMINNIKEVKDRQIRSLRQEQLKLEQQILKEQKDIRDQQAEQAYIAAMGAIRENNLELAKTKLLELENISPDYKKTRQMLSLLSNNNDQLNALANDEMAQIKSVELEDMLRRQAIEKQQKQLEEKKKLAEVKRAQQEQLQLLSQRAIEINDEIIQMTKRNELAQVKSKFAELQGVVQSYRTLRIQVSQEEAKEMAERKQAQELERKKKEISLAHREENRQKSLAQIQKENRQLYPGKRLEETTNAYRLREKERQMDMLYNQGVGLYEQKKYSQARLIFEELKNRQDRRANGWIAKLDRAVNQDVMRYKKTEIKQQSDYLNERLRNQKRAQIYENKERERQRQLAVAYENRRQAEEDAAQEQRRRVEALRLRSSERERQEEKEQERRQKVQQEKDMFGFKQIKEKAKKSENKKPVNSAQAEPKEAAEVNKEKPKSDHSKEEERRKREQEIERQKQIEISNKRKAYFEQLQANQEKKKKRQEENLDKMKQASQSTAGEKAFNDVIRKKEGKRQKAALLEKRNEEKRLAEEERQRQREQKQLELQQKEDQEREARIKQEQEKAQQEEERKARHEERFKQDQEEASAKSSSQPVVDVKVNDRVSERERLQAMKRQREEVKRQQEEHMRQAALEAKQMQEQAKQAAKQEALKRREEERKAKEEAAQLKEQKRQQEMMKKKLQMEAEAKQKEAQMQQQAQAREEARQKAEFDRQLKLKQQQMEEERLAIRRQMEEQTEAIYNQAMQLYQTRQYDLALQRFADVQDVWPNYKQTNAMIQKIQRLPQPAANETILDPVVIQKTPVHKSPLSKKTATPNQPPKSRIDAVSKTLDLFDPDVQ